MIKIDSADPEPEAVAKAVKVLKGGGIVAFPTETVYGIGAGYFDRQAVRKLSRIKKRPAGKPYTAQIADIGQLKKLSCVIDDIAAKLIDRFWPGPLTLVLPVSGGGKVGMRMPDHKVALEVIKKYGMPLAVPSANISGKEPPKTADDVLKQLDGKIDLLLDGGPADIGVESTILDLTVFPYKVLREGAVTRRQIWSRTGIAVDAKKIRRNPPKRRYVYPQA